MTMIRVFHHGRKWPRIPNHLDGRECPRCHVGVFGPAAQAAHDDDHADLDQLLDLVRSKLGITEEQMDGEWKWTAVMGDEPADPKAIEEAG